MTSKVQFLYCIRPARAEMLCDGPTEREATIVAEHFLYLQGLVEDGVVLMAGRTLNNDDTTFGLVVLVADSQAEAMAVMHGDPAVAQGVMKAQLFPYRVALWSKAGPDGGRNGT